MPYSGQYVGFSVPAAADLSSYQYRVITIDANGRGTISSANNGAAIGILQNKPTGADHPAEVALPGGIAKLVMGAACDDGAEICSNAQGFGTVAASLADHVVAMSLHSCGGSGDIIDVLVCKYDKV